MKDNNIIQIKTYAFAIKIVYLTRELQTSKKEYILSKQLARSGTAIGALIEESIGAQSGKDFYSKLTIAYKEARETKYWIKLLKDTQMIEETKSQEFLIDIEEILRIIGSIQKTLNSKALYS